MREILKEWVYEAVESQGGEAAVVEVAKAIWRLHSKDLKDAGDLFYTWQYDMRWAAQQLRIDGKLELSGRKWALKG